ncbi:MAG: sensor protein kinase [Rhizobiaceae bacterium]|nr:sensor protein kinase [Rhizobiaceae bacterium]
MRRLEDLYVWWTTRSLALQFLLAGGAVSLGATFLVGLLVTSQIEDGVTRNSAATTALYVDSVIAPLLPDMQRSQVLGDGVTQALDETLGQGALGTRLASFRLWRRDGTVLYARDKSLVGKRFEPDEDLEAAWRGRIVAEFGYGDAIGDAATSTAGQPLLHIFNPVLQPWSGEVVAVSEFHEIATDFQSNLRNALGRSWLAIALATLGFFLALSTIVLRGSRTIEEQSRALKERVGELSQALAQNRSLRLRVERASQRATAFNERFLRRIGADLHDGPAQLLAFAALRLDSAAVTDAPAGEKRDREVQAIKSSLDEAMREIRSICNGLVLPHIEAAALPDILELAAVAHERRTGSAVELSRSGNAGPLSAPAKICIYRFVQEALNNGFRHAGGRGQRVTQTCRDGRVVIEVSDNGPGFDPGSVRPQGLGLAGLRQRVESLGGRFDLASSAAGTRVSMSLDTEEMERA